MYYVYIINLSNGSYYHGFTKDLKNRFQEHQSGRVSSTKDYLPVKLTFYAAFDKKQSAIKFEKYLKTGSGYAFRNRHLI